MSGKQAKDYKFQQSMKELECEIEEKACINCEKEYLESESDAEDFKKFCCIACEKECIADIDADEEIRQTELQMNSDYFGRGKR